MFSREQLKEVRQKFRMSQSELARLADVARYKLVFFELGDRQLDANDQARLSFAIRREAAQLQKAIELLGIGTREGF
jgi:DNA-binding XRE family transcriptional regulator